MTGLFFASVVLIAAAVWLRRRMRARAARRRALSGPGSSLDAAIPVRSFAEIDEEIAAQRCECGTRLRPIGEGARQAGECRYRFARLACAECEEETVLYFDVSAVLH